MFPAVFTICCPRMWLWQKHLSTIQYLVPKDEESCSKVISLASRTSSVSLAFLFLPFAGWFLHQKHCLLCSTINAGVSGVHCIFVLGCGSVCAGDLENYSPSLHHHLIPGRETSCTTSSHSP